MIKKMGYAIQTIFFIFLLTSSAFSATIIDNTAKADYSVGSLPAISGSNKVTTIVCTQSKLEYLKYAPLSPTAEMVKVPVTSYLDATGSYSPLPPPVPLGSTSPLDISSPIPLIKGNVYHAGEPIFLRLTDDDQNIDTTAAETILLTIEYEGNGEKEILRLSETGPDTGVFVGYIQSTTESPIKWNGRFSVHNDSKSIAKYVENCGSAETVIEAVVDPIGVVFDSSNGQPVDGATVTLMDATAGILATVYGDDGVSIYPSTVTTGGTTSDSSGVVYTLSPGQYRFPFVKPGSYRLVVTPPANYRWSSTVPTSELNSLPGGPFAIEVGSKGEDFIVNPGPALNIDIPVDPVRTWLYLTKTASKETVAIGDFLQYKITVENTADIDIDGILVNDRLPLGFRYRKGSTKINGATSADPSISSDGRNLVFSIGTIVAGKTADITYVVEIAAGAKLGRAINFAVATGSGGVSNTASAEVLVKEDLFGSKTIIMGRVFPGCEELEKTEGELKQKEEPKVDEPEFIEIKREVGIELNSVLKNTSQPLNLSTSALVEYEVPIHVGEAPLKNLRLSVMLPDGVTYIKESSRIGDNPLPETSVMENVLTYRMGDVDANWEGRLRFSAEIPSEGSEGEFVTKAMLTFDTEGTKNQRTPLVENALARIKKTENVTIPPIVIHPHFISGSAELSSKDKAQLDNVVNELKDFNIVSMYVTGHTDSQRISKRLKPIYPDNYALSIARAKSVAEYLAEFLKLSPSQIIIDGKGPDEPAASNDNSEGMAQNRRVELRITAEKGNIWYELKNTKDRSGVRTVEINEKIETEKKIEDKKEISTSSLSTDGVAGVRIYLEDGTYAVTDKRGMYHFEGINPGTHVVQLDIETIPEDYELISCEENDRFAGTPYSQFVDLQGGTMWRADFYLFPKPKKEEPKLGEPETKEPEFIEIKREVGIELNSVLMSQESGVRSQEWVGSPNVDYEAPISIGDAPLKNLRLSVMLPDGVTYIKESSQIGENPLPDPSEMENVLTYSLGDVDANWEGRLRFSAEIPSEGEEGEFVTRAILTFDTQGANNQRTPLVENTLARIKETENVAMPPIVLHPHFISGSDVLSDEDKAQLDDVVNKLKDFNIGNLYVTGHTDSQRIGMRLKKTYYDNYILSLARALSVADYLSEALKLSHSRITIDGKGPDEPVASNETREGMALNRRVELNITVEKENTWYDLKNTKDKSGLRTVEVNEKIPNEKQAEPSIEAKKVDKKIMPEFDDEWLEKAETGLAFVWPLDGFYPPIPSVKIAVKHDPAKSINLLLNGEDVDPLYLDGTKKRSDNQAAVSLWIGIHIKDGDNLFEAVEYNPDGTESSRISKYIHYSGPPVNAALIAEKSRLIADGKTPPVIAIRLTDKDGHPAREGVVGEYKVDPPYMPLQKLEDLQKDPLTMSKSERLKYVVGEDGIALIELMPTSQTGEAALRFNLVTGENEVRTWLTPGERDWILVGLAEGTTGYNTVSGNMESRGSTDADDKYYKDGRLAFFAKGMIKGKWLLTIAYDSDKNGVKKNDSLHGIIDPDKYYTLYGDAAQQQYDAASARALYLKIERDRFYALFGDYETGLTVTELSRYSRNLNGLKSEMKGEKFDFNVFVSDTNQAFVKDEIRGDGTSGLYRLSRKNIVINSESITIETRDRFRSEVIISSVALSRHIDYNIDYDAGTIYFKSPVYSRDENFNPIYIVVDYESFDPSDMSYNYGGRGAVRMLENRVEVGATYIHEGRIGGEGDMTGIDAKLKLDDKTSIRAEFAQTDKDFNNVSSNGNAYLAEVSHRSEKLDGKVYVREQESEFGLGQQNGSESGTRKLGFDGTYRLDEKVSFRTEAFRQYNLATDAVRDMAEVQARYNEKEYEVHGGLRHSEDTLGNGDVNNSEQVTAGGSYRMLNDRLILRLEHDQSLFSNNENADYPTRTTIGTDYKLNETAALFVAHEFTQGENEDTQTTRIGMNASPWNGGQIISSLEQQYTENGTRVFSVNGIKQTWQITKKWSVDAGLDRSKTLKHPGNDSFNTNVPAASGGLDFTAVSLGAAYKEEKWGWTGRVEKRDSEDEDKIGLFTGAYGEVKEGLGLAANLQAFKSESSSGADKTSGNLRFSLAYRPKETKWIVLDRLDYIFDEQKGAEFDYDNWRIINNMNANYKANRQTQISLQYGAKYVNETIDERDYSGYTDLMGLEGRYDITKKWDIGLRGSVLHSWNAGQYKYSAGPSVGYNVMKNVWLSIGYNVVGFKDNDFSQSDFTAEGPYIKFRMKFDQWTVKDAVKWFSGQQKGG